MGGFVLQGFLVEYPAAEVFGPALEDRQVRKSRRAAEAGISLAFHCIHQTTSCPFRAFQTPFGCASH